MNVVFEKTRIHYRQEGEYALPNLEVPERPKVGAWVNTVASICETIKRHFTQR